MNNKNTVATTKEGKTTKEEKKAIQPNGIVITKVPNGKFVSIEEKKKRKEANEKQFVEFRVACLKRRAKREGLTDEETQKKIEELKELIEQPNQYNILIIFNPNNFDMIKQALLDNKIEYKLLSGYYGYIEGDQNVLNKVREIVTPETKVHPYVKKKPVVLEIKQPPKKKKKPMTKAEKKKLASVAKKNRKKLVIQAHFDHKKQAKLQKDKRAEKLLAIANSKQIFKNNVRSTKMSKKKCSKIIKMVNKKPTVIRKAVKKAA